MKLNRKLYILFLIPIFLIGILSLGGLLWSRYHFTTTVKNDNLKFEAALEMEISEKQALNNIADYIDTRKQESYQSYKENLTRFEHYFKQYEIYATSKNELVVLKSLEKLYQQFKVVTEELINTQNQQIVHLKAATGIFNEQVLPVVKTDWRKLFNNTTTQGNKKYNAMLELEVNIQEILAAMRGYVLDGDPFLKQFITNTINDTEHWILVLTKMKMTQDETVLLAQLKRNFLEAKNNTYSVLTLEDNKRQNMSQLTILSTKIDGVIDHKVQAPAQKDLNETQAKVSTINFAIVVILLIMMAVSAVIAWWFIREFFSKPVAKLRSLAENIAVGNTSINLDNTDKGEFGELYPSFQKLIENSQQLAMAAKALGKGEFDTEITPRSEDDTLGKSLQLMRDSLKELDTENKRQVWIKTQIANITQSSQGIVNLQKLLQTLIADLAEVLKAGYGAFYFLESKDGDQVDDDQKTQFLKLLASYGLEERKKISNHITIGSGLVGQCAFEKKPILLTDVPDDYIKISSGIGEAKPLNIMVLPIIHNENLLGVIEIASFLVFEDAEKTILKEVASNLGTIISNVISHQKTQDLLKHSQSMNEELTTQQEQLQQSNAQLEKQTQELRQTEEELRSQSEELRVMNEELEVKTGRLEEQKQELQQAQKELEQRAKDLAMSSKYKSEFLANMSHELRTPLNSLLILSKQLADNRENNLSEKQIKSAEVINKGGHELLMLINDILDLSKVEAGKLQADIQSCTLQEICDNIYHQFEATAEEKGLSLEIKLADGVPKFIESDEQRIIQILRNFISNALKFTEKGQVTVSVSMPKTAEIKVNGAMVPSDNFIAFSVSDTGIGIPADKQHLIFEAFQQAEGSTSRRYGGTGLGLAISRAMAELLGGEIGLESEEGKGSTFFLYLPLVEGSVAPATGTSSAVRPEALSSQPAPVMTYAGEKPVLLIVEDDLAFVHILSEYAEQQGYTVDKAHTGKDAIHKAQENQPSAIILDLGLPDIDGMKVLETLKHDPKTRHIPVHVVSGREDNTAVQEGAIGFLKKPISEDSLLELFNRFSTLLNADFSNVLIIDSNNENAKGIQNMLAAENVNTHICLQAEQALQYLQENSIDCIIMDLSMDDMSGFELLEKIDAKLDTLPAVIIYTAQDLTREEQLKLQKYTDSIVIKGENSKDRLLDEMSLFLHHVEADRVNKDKKSIKMLHSGDKVLEHKKILLVDDDMRNVFALSGELEEYAMDVIIANNGQQAVEKVQYEPHIDLVLMDIMMPIMDGYEAMREIRKLNKFKKLPIIALTAKAMKEDREKCISAGANDYITKPVEIDKLISMMKVWLTQ